jgi:hypothetical protein
VSSAPIFSRPIHSARSHKDISAFAAGSYAINVSGAVDPNYAFTYVPGTLVVTDAMPLLSYLGALSYVDEIGSADRNEQEERQNDKRVARNHLLLKIKNPGIRLPAGVK